MREPARVLVVDDDEMVRSVLQSIVEQLGVTVDAVATGQEALKALQEHVYQLVLIDIYMPFGDGITATRIIRETFPSDQQPVIVGLTGAATDATRAAALAAGMDACLFKPIEVETLQIALARWLRTR